MRSILVMVVLMGALIGIPITGASAQAVTTLPEAGTEAASEVAGVDQAVTDSVVRLYLAVFDRQPDRDGLHYWVDTYRAGARLVDLGAAFMVSPEWTRRYGAVDDAQFVELLYQNVLRRAADESGGVYWRETLSDGSSRADLLVYFSESAEFVTRTGTESPRAPYPPVPDNSGSGRRIVYVNSAQRIWLVEEDGSVHDSYPVSGRRETPSVGTYSVFSKSPKAWAGHDGITMNHMVRFANGRSLAIGFHSIPIYRNGQPMQTLAQLGTFQSAGCVRQEAGKAEMLYGWADIGTTVVVLR